MENYRAEVNRTQTCGKITRIIFVRPRIRPVRLVPFGACGGGNWPPIDNLIAAYARYGLKIGWRVMNYDTGVGLQYATPAWVFKSGTNPETGSVYLLH